MPQRECGYAGGLSPDNLEQELPKIEAAVTAGPGFDFWVDMESGVRTDNKFDLEKVRQVLSIAATFRSCQMCRRRQAIDDMAKAEFERGAYDPMPKERS